MENHDRTSLQTVTSPESRYGSLPLLGAVIFLLGFVAVNVAARLLSTDALPLPGSPDAEVYDYFRNNGDVSMATGLLQATSAMGLAVFVAAVTRRLVDIGIDPARLRLLRLFGAVAVIGLLLSAATAVVLAVSAGRAGMSTVALLQQVSFTLGGVVHVVVLGVLVWLLTRERTWSRPARAVGMIAAVPAVLSVLSVPVFAASVLLPVGRVLCMVWAVTAGVSAVRGRSLRRDVKA